MDINNVQQSIDSIDRKRLRSLVHAIDEDNFKVDLLTLMSYFDTLESTVEENESRESIRSAASKAVSALESWEDDIEDFDRLHSCVNEAKLSIQDVIDETDKVF